MNFLQLYSEALANPDSLQNFIKNNFDKVYDNYSLSNHEIISNNRIEFTKLTLHIKTISALDFSFQKNEAFLNLLLKTAVRLGDLFVFQQFHKILISKKLEQSNLIKACALFMHCKTSNDFMSVYDEMLYLLEESYQKETDSNKEPIAIFVYFYALFVKHFSEFATKDVIILIEKIKKSYNSKIFGFLDDFIIEQIIHIPINYEDNSYEKIQVLLDNFLERNKIPTSYLSGFLIEENTDYALKIKEKIYTISEIQEINKKLYIPIQTKEIFNSLGRGTAILEFEKQLLAYMYSHGQKHIAKLKDAFTYINEDLKEVNIIDWGCGQGIASKSYLDFFGSNQVKSIVLIEPSVSALKRAALHVNNEVENIKTINKEFDFIEEIDLEGISSSDRIDIHLFSNVIDMDFFDLSKLIALIKKSFKGVQYFFVISPHIDASKTERINLFTEKLINNNGVLLFNETKSKGNWINGWSKVIRIFKVHI